MRPTHAIIVAAVCGLFAVSPAHAAESEPDCITLSEVVIVTGAETAGTKRLCKAPGSVRYNIVEAAVYDAALTQAAFDRASAPQLRAMRGEIELLRAQVAASTGEATTANDALARAQQEFVAQLAAKDRAYAEAIALFRGAVDDIASTPDGAAALAQYNAGNEAEAITVLDRLNAAHDAARQKQSVAEKRRIARLALDARLKGKVSLASVIARFEEVTQLDSERSEDWIDLGRLYLVAGKSDAAASAFEIARRVATDDRARQIAGMRLGEALLVRGDDAASSAAQAESLAIARRLVAADPGNAQAQRDLAVALHKISSVRARQGDLAGADQALGESLAIFRRLAATDPGNAQAQRDLSVGLQWFGNELAGQDDLAGADRAHGESLAISRRLAAADPGNTEAQRDVAIDLWHIGDLRARQGDLAGADQAYDEGLALRRRLAADASNAQAQHDFSIGLRQFGGVRARQDDLAGADLAYDESLAIVRRLAAADPGDAGVKRNVADTLFQIGNLRVRQGELAGADQAFGESLEILRRLAATNPRNVEAQRDVSRSLERIGGVRLRRGELAGAEQAYGESLEISRRLVANVPGNAGAQRDLAVSLYKMAGLSNSGVGWRDVVAQMEGMAAKGILAPADQRLLDQARKFAARQQAR